MSSQNEDLNQDTSGSIPRLDKRMHNIMDSTKFYAHNTGCRSSLKPIIDVGKHPGSDKTEVCSADLPVVGDL